MKITEINLARYDSADEIQFSSLSPQLNVIYGGDNTGKSSLANLVGQLLYGKRPFRNETSAGSELPRAHDRRLVTEGALQVSSPHGTFNLRRHGDGTPLGRLTVAAASGAAVDGQTVQTLLAGLSPRLLSRIFAIDFAHPPRVEDLLSSQLIGQYEQGNSQVSTEVFSCREHPAAASATGIDRRKVDDLVHRRDELAKQIEQQMAGRRNDSATLEQEIAEVDAALHSKRQAAEAIEVQFSRVVGELATIESRLRYFSMEAALRNGPQLDADEYQTQLEELDAEIGRCRQTLSDLQSRDAVVRRDLATVHADGTADNSASLADQRVTVSTLERLLDDLDAETALLARAHQPGRCIAPESHARLTPVVELLRQQVYTLCGQLTEQERASQRRQLNAESRQLARAQSDLSERLEHLLERRQTLTHQAQLAGQPVVLLPQAPVARHCQCEHHGEFINQSEAMLLGNVQRGRYEHEANENRRNLRLRRDELTDTRDRIAQEITKLESQWEQLQKQRAELVGRTTVDALREELRTVEQQLQQALEHRTSAPANRAGGWRASDILAQLTDGRLQQIRVAHDRSAATIVDSSGRARPLAQLHASERDQVCLALTLAIVSSHASRDIRLPLLLDEPFLRQDAASSAAMAGVLEEFSRQSCQLLVFTGDHDARRRFESLGVEIYSIEHREAVTPPTPVRTEPIKSVVAEETAVRVVRESISAGESRETSHQLRVTGWSGADDDHEVYYLAAEASLADFPVLGAETERAFGALGLRTVLELLESDPVEVSDQLARAKVSAATVRLWQTHMSLMCFVPGVSLDDAQVLAASGIDSPADLDAADLETLEGLIAEFLTSDRGQRYEAHRSRYSQESLSNWKQAVRRNRQRWQEYASLWAAHRSRLQNATGRDQPAARAARSEREQPKRRRQRAARPQRELEFYLGRDSEVVDAPSIGPKTAERLADVGIRSVADLLNADAESTASELDVSYITADTIAAWQYQARLVCCIPELRGFGAQLLVGCGITEPEQIAGAREEELFRKVRNFSRSSAGQRILRDGKGPNQDKVAEWIECAAHMRPLEAA